MIHKIRCMLMIALMLQTCFIPMSCMTMESYKGSYLDEEEFSVDKIRAIHLKSGEKISVEEIRLIKSTSDSVYAFVINVYDTTWADKKSYKLSATLDTIRMEDVRAIIVKDFNVPLTIIAGLGITAGVLLIVGIIAFALSDKTLGFNF